MVDQRIKATFNNTYRDDYADSAGYYRILFNNGRAVQARELTQLQTIIQSEITRLGNNLFKDGAAVNPGSPTVDPYRFVKLNTSVNTLPATPNSLVGTEFTGGTSGIKAIVKEVVVAEGADPATLYVSYTDGLSDGSQITFTAGEDISNGSTTLTVQTTNTVANPAMGKGLRAVTGGGDFYATGRFVYAPAQSKILSKYSTDVTEDLGFQIFEEIVTATDVAQLYDNSGENVNTTSPGADRYRIRLVLNIRSNLSAGDNFVYVAKIRNGVIVSDVKAESENNYNILRDVLAQRTKEESGDYIVEPFLISFDDNDSDNTKLDIDISKGIAYVDGYRAAKDFSTTLTVDKPRTTTTVNNEVVAFDIGNYVVIDPKKGLPNIDEFPRVNLNAGTGYGGLNIGQANIRAIEEGTGSYYHLYLFDIEMNAGKNFRDVRSIGTDALDVHDLVLENSQAVLKRATVNNLLFELPSSRPSTLADISLATQRRFTTSTNASGEATISLTAAGETFTNTGDWIVALTNGSFETPTAITGAGSTTATLTGLTASRSNLEIIAYVNKASATVRSKTLTSKTRTLTPGHFDSDGNGLRWAPLTDADIFSYDAIKVEDSDGVSIANSFITDNGQRDNYYDNGRIVLKSGASVPTTDVFVRYRYFTHGASGDFFAANSYTGQIDYEDIPSHTRADGVTVPLRNVIDFRPVVNSSGNFGTGAVVHELPQTNSLVTSDVTYYMGTRNKLVINTKGDLSFIEGDADITPAFPATPDDALELYRITLNPYVLSPSDTDVKKIDHKRYTMSDIGRLEDRIDRVEELAVLSLLELDTANINILDSAGTNRTKSGFLADNFKDHSFTETTNPDHRSAIDPQFKYMRPRGVEDAALLEYDSASSSNTILRGDNVYLTYGHRVHINQDAVTGTENVCPFITPSRIGNITLSPASDSWIEQEYVADRIINGGTQLVTSNGNAWNSTGWNWQGTPLDQLQVGSQTNTQISDVSTSGGGISTRATRTGNTWTSVTSQQFTTTGTATTNTVTATETINRVVGDRLLSIAVIPFMRSRKIYFKAEGLRPNTRVFPFFDGVRVDDWVKQETFVRSNGATDFGNGENNASGHPDGSSSLVADATGKVEGSFFLPSTANLKFRTGERPFTLNDVTNTTRTNGTSFGETFFTSEGTLETRQRTVQSTRRVTVTQSSQRTSSTTSRVIATWQTGGGSDGTGGDPPGPDPLAQSFMIDQPSGVFVTKFDFYFKTKADTDDLPVWVELRPMEDGTPSNKVIPGSVKFVYPSTMSVSDDASVATTFEFDEPIYLSGGKEYAVVLRAHDTDYEVYISKVGEFLLGTTDQKVTRQPFFGALFKSQNASTWSPSQWEDLSFKMYVAEFSASSGTAVLNNTNLAQKLLTEDPLSVDSADATITVYQPAHGLTVGDDVTISGATAFAGISASSINGDRTITAVDANGYTFEADSSSTSALAGGGSAVKADKNIPMDIIIPTVQTLQIDGTNIAATGEFTTGQSLAGTETAYQKESAVNIELNRPYQFSAPHLIANDNNETDNMSGNKSLTLNITMTTDNDYVSPVIDMQRAIAVGVSNRIDKQASSAAAGFNVPINYVAETNPGGGSHAAKHITKPVTLADDAVGIKVIAGVHRPSASDFLLYYRTANDENIQDLPWVLADDSTKETTPPSDENPAVFRDYEYLIGGQGGDLQAFSQFQLKIVMRSTNSSKVPIFRDLRAIALGV